MITLKSLLRETYYYHVTPRSNVEKISTQGLIPNVPTDKSGEEKAVYLFPTREDAEDSWDQWMSDRFNEDEDLVMLTIGDNGLRIEPSSVGWEVVTRDVIPPSNIVSIEAI